MLIGDLAMIDAWSMIPITLKMAVWKEDMHWIAGSETNDGGTAFG